MNWGAGLDGLGKLEEDGGYFQSNGGWIDGERCVFLGGIATPYIEQRGRVVKKKKYEREKVPG